MRVTVVFFGEKNIDEIVEKLKNLTKKYECWAIADGNIPYFHRVITGAFNIDEVVDASGVVVVVAPDQSVLSKIITLNADNPKLEVVVKAYKSGKPLILCKDAVMPENISLSSGVYRKTVEMLNAIASMGIKVVSKNFIVWEVNDITGFGKEQKPITLTKSPEQESHSGTSTCSYCVPKNVEVRDVVDRISVCHNGDGLDPVHSIIDHTLLKPNATQEDIKKLCEEARKYRFASVCVNPHFVSLASHLLKGSGVRVTTVVGFPLGATTTSTKVQEAREAIANGADEIDMVINIGALKSGDDKTVLEDIKAVREVTKGHILKVIIETGLLTKEEKIRACLLAKEAGADFVKTSTGFSGGGATVEDVMLMREVVGKDIGVKASGGIRDITTARKLIAAGATRLGTSASVEIIKGGTAKGY